MDRRMRFASCILPEAAGEASAEDERFGSAASNMPRFTGYSAKKRLRYRNGNTTKKGTFMRLLWSGTEERKVNECDAWRD